ncbi:hypothetical protein OPT61_g6952 [Boeremia exigua]|uniref:Uncharacterized protein n=1 Tax=Boeremia exigua TaxID=749465 RepID=A0ACC2I457_9PLEO|nr:hypothetical protein OPT61_g6952 [Boeremia exigua]
MCYESTSIARTVQPNRPFQIAVHTRDVFLHSPNPAFAFVTPGGNVDANDVCGWLPYCWLIGPHRPPQYATCPWALQRSSRPKDSYWGSPIAPERRYEEHLHTRILAAAEVMVQLRGGILTQVRDDSAAPHRHRTARKTASKLPPVSLLISNNVHGATRSSSDTTAVQSECSTVANPAEMGKFDETPPLALSDWGALVRGGALPAPMRIIKGHACAGTGLHSEVLACTVRLRLGGWRVSAENERLGGCRSGRRVHTGPEAVLESGIKTMGPLSVDYVNMLVMHSGFSPASIRSHIQPSVQLKPTTTSWCIDFDICISQTWDNVDPSCATKSQTTQGTTRIKPTAAPYAAEQHKQHQHKKDKKKERSRMNGIVAATAGAA